MHLPTPRSGLWRAFTTALAFATVLTPTLQASPAMEKLFYILKQKGSITADEYDLLIALLGLGLGCDPWELLFNSKL